MDTKRKTPGKTDSAIMQPSMQLRSIVSPELLQNQLKGYVKGVTSEELLFHAEVVNLSEKIKVGLSLEEHKSSEHPFGDRPLEPYVMPPRSIQEMRQRVRRAMIRAPKKVD